jgi:peptidoglycan L-alanyl-D-glutamate endopeptidase CwlK
MPYRLSALSRRHLVGVHPDLVACVQEAIALTPQDFRVQEGVRTVARQRALLASGASQTMDSRHLTGHAVDLVALVGGVPRWDWPLYYSIVPAMAEAARKLRLPLIWGGTWAYCGNILTPEDAELAVLAYGDASRAKGRRPFTDGPHYQLDRRAYP